MRLSHLQALLFVPAGKHRFVESAVRHAPDAVILDLEDAVAPHEKDAARSALADHQAALTSSGIPAVVRVNSGLADLVADISALDIARTTAVMLAKCSSLRQIENASELLAARERTLGLAPVPLLALVEQPAALPHLFAIASSPRVKGMMFGPEDYSADLGTASTSPAIEMAAMQLTAACAAHGLLAIGIAGPMGNFRDTESYATLARRARLLGFHGAAAIHPSQIALIRQGFAPDAEEVDKARAVIAAFESGNTGAIAHEGEMLDLPIINQARRVLGLAEKAKARPAA